MSSVSALAPITQPSDVPWGQLAFQTFLGEDRSAWAAWDARSLLAEATERGKWAHAGQKQPFRADE